MTNQKRLRQIALELAALLNHDMTPERTQEARDKADTLQAGLTGNEPPLVPGETLRRYMVGNPDRLNAVTLKA